MPPTLLVTIGASNANSYVSMTEAEDYVASRLDTAAWEKASAPRRIAALLQAARRLEDEAWIGERVTATQALAWPRYDAQIPDTNTWAGNFYYGGGWASGGWTGARYYESTEIPVRVKQAQIELALAYLDGWSFDDGADEAVVNSFESDGVKVQFGAAERLGLLPAAVTRLLDSLTHGGEFVRG